MSSHLSTWHKAKESVKEKHGMGRLAKIIIATAVVLGAVVLVGVIVAGKTSG